MYSISGNRSRGVSMKDLNDLKQEIYSLENALLQPQVRGSAEELHRLLAEDFIEFGKSGTVFNKERIVRELPKDSPINIIISDFEVKHLEGNILLATYKTTNIDNKTSALRSSIWRLEDKGWRIVFHQGTATK